MVIFFKKLNRKVNELFSNMETRGTMIAGNFFVNFVLPRNLTLPNGIDMRDCYGFDIYSSRNLSKLEDLSNPYDYLNFTQFNSSLYDTSATTNVTCLNTCNLVGKLL
jgi:hypothetical protein